MFGRLNGAIFATLLFISSFLGSIFILFPCTPFAYFAPRLWRRWADRFVGYWLIFPSSMLFFIFGMKFHVSGDMIDRSKPALIIMNHRTRLDWLFFWNCLYTMDPWLLTTEKISLKSSLKKIPGAGWAMGCGAYIFMNRNYEHDRRILKFMLKYYKDSLGCYQLLLFPEGTDRGERAARISDEFADRHGLPRYEYLLHPRTTGFNYILNKMRENQYVENVYDVTIAYPEQIVSSEMDLLRYGKFPQAVHFDIKRYSVDEIVENSDLVPIPSSSSSLLPNVEEPTIVDAAGVALPRVGSGFTNIPHVDASRWLTTLWRKKEERLRKFYAPSFVSKRIFTASGEGFRWPVTPQSYAYYVAFLFWIFFLIFWIYWLLINFWVKIYAVVAVCFFVWAERRSGGVEFLAVEWFYGREMFFSQTATTTHSTFSKNSQQLGGENFNNNNESTSKI